MNAAQDEFDALFREDGKSSRHPEDQRNRDSDDEPTAEREHFFEKDDDGSDEDDIHDRRKDTMRSRYYLPSLQSNANTGPKGVIADAQAFEEAKKSRRMSWLRGMNKPQGVHAAYSSSKDVYPSEEKSSDEDTEEGFLSRWRQNRLKELQEAGRRVTSRSRTNSPGKRIYGNLPTVDAQGFLDAVEKVHADTMVVVYIYDDLVCLPRSIAKTTILTVSFPVRYQRADRGSCPQDRTQIPHHAICQVPLPGS